MIVPAGWAFAAASATGTSHAGSGAGCQDSHLCEVLRDADGAPVLLMVASDGAGSATHSARGSQIACESLREQIADALRRGLRVPQIERQHADALLDGIRESIADAAGGVPGTTMRDFAATLLFAIVSSERAVFGQIGDGAIVLSAAKAEWHRVFKPAKGMYANETYFVTQNDAVDHLQFAVTSEPLNEIAVFTDGLERLLLDEALGDAHAPVFEKMFTPLRALGTPGRSDPLSDALRNYLGSPAVGTRTDDDVTLLIAVRRP